MRAAPLVLVPLLLAACGESSPTAPRTPLPGPEAGRPEALVLAVCAPGGQDVVCRAVMSPSTGGVSDVTGSARWAAVPAGVAEMVAPGRFRPLREGEFSVEVQHDGAETLPNPYVYLVAPGRPARPLRRALVVVTDTSNVPLSGATVQILDGYRAGASCTTDVVGVCSVDRVPEDETLTVRVTKPGYHAATATYPPGVPGIFLFRVTLARE